LTLFFCLFVCFGFFTNYLFFSFSFTFFAFHLLSPFHSKSHHCYYNKLENA
jgi:hypothetical protein